MEWNKILPVMRLQYCPYTPPIKECQRYLPCNLNVPCGVAPPVPVEQIMERTNLSYAVPELLSPYTQTLWLPR